MYADTKLLHPTKTEVQRIADNIGFDTPLDFIIEKVFFETDLGNLTTDKYLIHQFIGGILDVTQFDSKFSNANPLNLTSAYYALSHLINISIRKPIKRDDISHLILKSVESAPLRFEKEGLKVRLFHWEDQTFNLSQNWDLLLDWSNYFDRRSREVPSADIWNTKLIPELVRSEKMIRSNTNSRTIVFYPGACLSAGIALGWAFSEVKGYSFIIRQDSRSWRSSIEPSNNKLIVKEKLLDNTSKDLLVKFSIVADVSKQVENFTKETSQNHAATVTLFPDTDIGSRLENSMALAYAYDAKRVIREKVDFYDCDLVHLFIAAPLSLSIFFGRLLNALHADIQCYEEQLKGYTASCFLETRL
jgi:hypothetical protein